ncbi:FAD:protein FMN transferase [Rhodococcus tukisamuensis]|uniref:Thiamine biosynthesis lipoprotein n=1 Tax=Rhodococcus tukisamuensis TaxID=168276 RepID=A0A1G6PEB3_9NOCA|nr:FAD:protein FMN transferase [Rhodococcus tukisamuensis]SDC78590.1 thiamine biosynthesis lipoprotein [Rhodococcus tukisamuensis]
MVPSTQWSTWGSEIEVRVTEGAALGCAADIVSAALADVRAACDLTRGDAEIHAVNMAQGVPVQASRRLLALIRSALWAARMTGGAVSPLSREPVDPARVPSIHLEPTFADVRVTGDTVFAPFGVCLDITGTAKAGTAHEAARVAAASLECGVLVRVGDVVATAGHCPIGGWQVDIGASTAPGNFTTAGTCVEVLTGTALARARAAVPGPDVADAGLETVTVIAEDGLWAYAAAAAALGRGVAALRWLAENDLAGRVAYRRGSVRTTEAWTHLSPHGHVA